MIPSSAPLAQQVVRVRVLGPALLLHDLAQSGEGRLGFVLHAELMLDYSQEGHVCGHVLLDLFGLVQGFIIFFVLSVAVLGSAKRDPMLWLLGRQPACGFRRIMANSATNACRSP